MSTPQARASDPRHSAWVAANAGSGKTHALVQRILRLLLSGTPPQRILCLTFTKAAAAEMSVRLYKSLSRWIAASDEKLTSELEDLGETAIAPERLAVARRLFARVLETPGGLKIQTIHAFCERLLQQFPVEAGLAPGFQVIEEAETQALREACRRAVLDDADPGLAAARAILAQHTTSAAFARLIEAMTSRDLDGSADAAPRLATALGLDPGDTAETVALELQTLGKGDYPRAASILEGTGLKTDGATAGRIRTALLVAGSDAAGRAIEDLFLTGAGAPRQPGSIMGPSTQRAHPRLLEFLVKGQERLLRWQDKRTALEMVTATRALTLLSARAGALYAEAKRARGAYDFDDLIVRARGLLTEERAADWVLYKLDGGIDHLLVDEAQDTSPAQWDIVRALTAEFFAGAGARSGGRTVFAVGDRKQSIYSFQGADPAAFDEAKRHYETVTKAVEQPFVPASLTISYRSGQAVLDAVDRTFALPTASKGVTHDDGKPDPHEAERRHAAGFIEIWPPAMPEDKPQNDAWSSPTHKEPAPHPTVKLADAIASTIAQWLKDGRMLESRGRPVRPGDILILLRKRAGLADALLRALAVHGIPAAGADRLRLGAHAAVGDLLALARAVLLPEDDLSLAEVLKSPLCPGFGDDDLFALAHGRGGETLWSRLADGDAHAGIAQEFKRWRSFALTLPPHEFFARVLATGEPSGRMRLMSRLGMEIADPLEAFLDQALSFERTGGASLVHFLDWFDSGSAEIKRDMEHGRDEVRVMTVHGAKGLEANVVFLADTWRPPNAAQGGNIVFCDPGDGRPLAIWLLAKRRKPKPLEALLEPVNERMLAEYRRLLYVAMTRAADELYICAAATRHGASADSWYSLVTAALGAAPPGGPHRPLSKAQQGPPKDNAVPSENLAAAGDPPWLAWHALASKTDTAASRPSDPRRSEDTHALMRGRVIHRLLEVLAAEPEATRPALALRLATRQGFGAPEAEEAIGVLASPAFAEWAGPESLIEAEIAGPQFDAPARVDRLTIAETEIRILDFKTAQHPPAQISEDDRTQLNAYAALLTQAFPARRIRAALFWTATCTLMELLR